MLRRASSHKRKTPSFPCGHQRASAKPSARKSMSALRSSLDMSDYLQQLGERLRAARVRRGFTQDQLAKRCSLSSRFVAKVEVGGGNISVARLHELARALDVPVETLAAENLPASPAFEQSTTFLKKLAPSDLDHAHKLLLEKF